MLRAAAASSSASEEDGFSLGYGRCCSSRRRDFSRRKSRETDEKRADFSLFRAGKNIERSHEFIGLLISVFIR